ncbi:LOW QUALITY PROTEIN: cathepsin L 2-like [Hippocampus zosterae]|uniref:LOW QUALITY PROTEIN: cathepsin L 2-like n=1 Tax=Hippocampus zosterae TaxID=109293 RepID=UPI00223D1266|nr:LOW QUALITY PROTEIN: cathepsin L 2-like [Hippocampus zosterae]
MKSILAIIGSVALATYFVLHNKTSSGLYESWKVQHGVEFLGEEDSFRRAIFEENMRVITEHNAKADATYKMGVNQFSAMTSDEFVSTYLGYIEKEDKLLGISEDFEYDADIDWTDKGVLTDIKDQGRCGSCWAFSATGALEAMAKAKTGELPSLSEQQLVDCSRSYGNMGCNGGLMDSAFKYTRDHGITTESAYPYTAKDGSCKSFTSAFKNAGFTDVRGCSNLYTALAGRPVSVAVDATNWSRYSSGVFNNCGTRLNHGVLLVGATDQFWTIKNSWSTSSGWGERGFIRISRGNTCGLCNQPSYPN